MRVPTLVLFAGILGAFIATGQEVLIPAMAHRAEVPWARA